MQWVNHIHGLLHRAVKNLGRFESQNDLLLSRLDRYIFDFKAHVRLRRSIATKLKHDDQNRSFFEAGYSFLIQLQIAVRR